jgi:hypothetical protein
MYGQKPAAKAINVFVYSINWEIHRSTSAKSTSATKNTGCQITIHEALGLSPNNDQHNYALGQLQRLFDARNNEFLLMN